jgi:hypothetical protein
LRKRQKEKEPLVPHPICTINKKDQPEAHSSCQSFPSALTIAADYPILKSHLNHAEIEFSASFFSDIPKHQVKLLFPELIHSSMDAFLKRHCRPIRTAGIPLPDRIQKRTVTELTPRYFATCSIEIH